MGQFGCHCGNTISDSSSPCPDAGLLTWEPEIDLSNDEFVTSVSEFLSAIELGNRNSWINEFFGSLYPLDLGNSTVISDIYSSVSVNRGRSVLRCSECERIYIHTKSFENQWTCYEKRI